VRVWDTRNRIYQELRDMRWRDYLAAMWILCGELESMYSAELDQPERTLMRATTDLVRATVLAESDERDIDQERAAKLEASWGRLLAKREAGASAGQLNLWMTFEGLAGEIAGDFRRYYAAERVMNAVTSRLRGPSARRFRKVDPDEVVEDDSPMGLALARFERVVCGVAQATGAGTDPVQLRAGILDA
jgi:hypothetical protein